MNYSDNLNRAKPTLNQLHAAQREVDFAEQNCPHWDIESDNYDSSYSHECCCDLAQARIRLRRLKRESRKT